MLVARGDSPKYPFTKDAKEYIDQCNVSVEELATIEYAQIIDRAEQRIEEALINGSVRYESSLPDVEVLSFPVAIILVASIGDDFLKRRYALAEAIRAENLLKDENNDKLMRIIESYFSWRIKKVSIAQNQPYEYCLSFIDYIKNASVFHEDEWKLVNKMVIGGYVFLRKNDVARLAREEIQKYIQETVEKTPKLDLPKLLNQRIERINQILTKRKESFKMDELPKTAIIAAYPPCIKKLYDSLLIGQHISHIGRFSLTSFLLAIGINTEDLLKMYTSISDFSESLTRYQIEHIAGKKGAGTSYKPPNCSTLRTHGLCLKPDELCKGIRHPLTYYRRKIGKIGMTKDE
ncbi:MAG: primase large subunit PriL [Thermoproteota archaeon]|nr:primase large subunit PriL [Thermoproteota archaeon]